MRFPDATSHSFQQQQKHHVQRFTAYYSHKYNLIHLDMTDRRNPILYSYFACKVEIVVIYLTREFITEKLIQQADSKMAFCSDRETEVCVSNSYYPKPAFINKTKLVNLTTWLSRKTFWHKWIWNSDFGSPLLVTILMWNSQLILNSFRLKLCWFVHQSTRWIQMDTQ